MAVVIGVLVWLNVSDDDPEEGAAPSDSPSPSTTAGIAAPAEGVFVVDVAGGAGGVFLTPEPVRSGLLMGASLLSPLKRTVRRASTWSTPPVGAAGHFSPPDPVRSGLLMGTSSLSRLKRPVRPVSM